MTSTPILTEAANLLGTVLIDSIQILDVGQPVTVGTKVTRPLTPAGDGKPVNALVQTTSLLNAVESRTINTYSVKVAQGTALRAGQAVKVLFCRMEPDLSQRVLLIDKVSENGMSLIRKAVASDYTSVNQEGKANLS